MNLTRDLMFIIYLVTTISAMPYQTSTSNHQFRRSLDGNEHTDLMGPLPQLATTTTMITRQNCLAGAINLDECQDSQQQVALKTLSCLNGCANCVKQWKTGVYNGRQCADDCMQQVAELESVDPDCNLVKYFNSTALGVK